MLRAVVAGSHLTVHQRDDTRGGGASAPHADQLFERARTAEHALHVQEDGVDLGSLVARASAAEGPDSALLVLLARAQQLQVRTCLALSLRATHVRNYAAEEARSHAKLFHSREVQRHRCTCPVPDAWCACVRVAVAG